VKKAFDKLKLPQLDESMIKNPEVDNMLSEWRKVVILFALSLMVAPVIETVIILDRMIYLSENGKLCIHMINGMSDVTIHF